MRSLSFWHRVRTVTVNCWVIALAAFGISASAQAANDNLRDALRLLFNGRVTVDTSNYSREIGETGTGNTNSRTAWFVYTAPEGAPGVVRLSTYGSNHDTVINLYKRDLAAPSGQPPLITSLLPVSGAPENPVNVSDDATINVTTGYVAWSPQVGTTYFISVGRNGGGGGNSTLEVTFGPVTASDGTTALIPNDNFATPLEFVATVTAPTAQVPRGEDVPGTTIGATAETGEQNLNGAAAPRGGTVWYKYRTGTVPEVFSAELADVPADGVGDVILQAFTNGAAPVPPTFPDLVFEEEDRTSSITGQPRLVINAAANEDYYFRVTSTDGDGVLFNIRLDFNPIAPPNDNIASAIALPPSVPAVRNQGEDIYSATATDPTGFAGNTSGANVWYSWKAPANGLVRIRAIAPTATGTTGNFHPVGSTFLFDCEVHFDTSNPTDAIFDTATAQRINGFDEGTVPQERTFYALKDVVYFVEIGGDNDRNDAGRGFFGFAIEDARVVEVARTGVSYGPEGVLKLITAPVINRTGDVAFHSTFELGGPIGPANERGLFLFNSASTRVVVTKGTQEFGTPLDIDGDGTPDDKVVFNTFSDLFLADRSPANNPDPDLGFTATLSGNSDDEPVSASNNKGFYRDDPVNAGTRELRLKEYVNDAFTSGDGAGFLAAFNTPVRETLDNTALVTGKMSGIPAVRDTAIFASTRDVVLQEEDPAPNTADGVEFGDVSGTPTVNSSNNLAFRAILRGPGVAAANDTALYSVASYRSAPSALNYHLRLRKGTPAAGEGGVLLADGGKVFTIGEPRINGTGRIALLTAFAPGSGTPAVTAATDTAILSDLASTDESFAVVAREGDLARSATGQTIPGMKFVSFSTPVLITNNAVIFTAKVAGAGVTKANATGIWIWDGASTYLVARGGSLAPGILPAGATFKKLGTPLANPSGRIAFIGTLAGAGVAAANDAGLWTLTEDGTTPALRLRKGDVYNFGSTELPINRVVNSIELTAGSGGDDGAPRGMDQDGNVAVLVGLGKGPAKSGQAVFKVAP